jgi:hypothetical protein
MNRRIVGAIFIFIAAFLEGVRYISAALFGSGSTSGWTQELFDILLTSVGTKLVFLSTFALIIGIVYLIWAEIEINIGKIKSFLSKKI